jgi:hypothetical protein
LPAGKWNYFCLDNILYHGHHVSIVWDKDGGKYHAGRGLSLWVDGKKVGCRPTLGRIIADL